MRHCYRPDENPDHDILETLPGPDFSTGGELLFDEAATRGNLCHRPGQLQAPGKMALRQGRQPDRNYGNPYTTATEVIMDKVAELIKAGKIKEIADMRDETDLGGLKLTIDLKRGVDPEKLMQKLFRLTPLQDSFPCNFNILIAGMPRVMGVGGDSGRVDGMAHVINGKAMLLLSGGIDSPVAGYMIAKAWCQH